MTYLLCADLLTWHPEALDAMSWICLKIWMLMGVLILFNTFHTPCVIHASLLALVSLQESALVDNIS